MKTEFLMDGGSYVHPISSSSSEYFQGMLLLSSCFYQSGHDQTRCVPLSSQTSPGQASSIESYFGLFLHEVISGNKEVAKMK